VCVIVPPLGGEDRTTEYDEDDKSGKYAAPGVDCRDPPGCGGVHAASHDHEFHKDDCNQSEHYELVQDGQCEIEVEHGLVSVATLRAAGRVLITSALRSLPGRLSMPSQHNHLCTLLVFLSDGRCPTWRPALRHEPSQPRDQTPRAPE
jgi:hypothetical protein